MARRWSPSLHPRGANGKFVSKASSTTVSARVGLRSVSAGLHYTKALPRDYQVHVSTVVRLEKVSAQATYLQRLSNAVLLRIVDKLPNARLQNIARRAIEDREVTGPKGVKIGLPTQRSAKASSVRLRRAVGAGKAITSGSRMPRKGRIPRRSISQRRAKR